MFGKAPSLSAKSLADNALNMRSCRCYCCCSIVKLPQLCKEEPPAQAGGFFCSERFRESPSVSAKSLADNALMCHTADCGKMSQSVRDISTTEL